MKYGFVIDHRKCIGCHACTVACKEEHSVPLGVNRTWVKYIEKGEFPDTQRRFLVLRCNHCEDSPCTRICPTRALFVRPDGIVDFDNSRCIGCKACMQACPYDALYLDPNTSTAAKCNFCAHRVELGLEPSCVVVCPERAIVAGDLEDANAEIARLLSREQIQVRKPEQGTKPKLFYIGADATALNPAAAPVDGSYLWAHPRENPNHARPAPVSPGSAPLQARRVLDVHHHRPWGSKIALYLWTKAAAAGVMILAALLVNLPGAGDPVLTREAPLVSLFFLMLTSVLLVADLKRPDRFLYLLTKSNFSSWLVRGAYILSLFGAAAAAWFVAAQLGRGDIVHALTWPVVVLGAAAAGYSAFLFAQAEGRDFWQSPVLLWHLLAAALLAGSAVLLVLTPMTAAAGSIRAPLSSILAGALVLDGLLILGELYVPHVNADVRAAALMLRQGAYRFWFWGGVVGVGFVLPLVLLNAGLSGPLASIQAALPALAGLYLYEDLWVRAGQAVPLS